MISSILPSALSIKNYPFKGGLDESSPYTILNRYKINHCGLDELNPYVKKLSIQRWA
jgi:hypothetical protein